MESNQRLMVLLLPMSENTQIHLFETDAWYLICLLFLMSKTQIKEILCEFY